MILDKDTMLAMETVREEFWKLFKAAEKSASETIEAMQAKSLNDKWYRMTKKIEAAKLLLEDESMTEPAE